MLHCWLGETWPPQAPAADLIIGIIYPLVESSECSSSCAQLRNAVCMDLSGTHGPDVPFDSAWMG